MKNSNCEVSQFMKCVIQKFDSIRGCSAKEDITFPFWDTVAISTSDEIQEEAFRLQITKKIEKKELPKAIPFHIFSDPKDCKIGNGGSALDMLSQLYRIYGGELFNMRILLIFAGGYSQRLPTASVIGKLFTPIPIGQPMYQMLELKLAMYIPFIQFMGPGVFFSCADDIETYCFDDESTISWSGNTTGFVALGHKSSPIIGEQHGVYILPQFNIDNKVTFTPCLKVLQKPSVEMMKKENAIIEGFGTCTDSAFYISRDITKKLIDFYVKNGPFEYEIDAYGDFLQALGREASNSYITDNPKSPVISEIRRKIFHLLHGSPLHVLVLHQSAFYHLGTVTEYLENLTGFTCMKNELDLQSIVFSKLVILDDNRLLYANNEVVSKFALKHPTVAILHSIIPVTANIRGPCVIEYCSLRAPMVISENCILSYICVESNDLLTVPPNCCFHTIPVTIGGETKYVTIAFNALESPKKECSENDLGNLFYFSKNLKVLKDKLGINNLKSLFDSQEQTFSLWTTKLFSAADTMSDSFKISLNFIQFITDTAPGLQENPFYKFRSPENRFSMKDLLKLKNIKELLHYQSDLANKLQI